jgi:hypothetical protein
MTTAEQQVLAPRPLPGIGVSLSLLNAWGA